VVPEFRFFSQEECDKGPADIAEADDAELVGPNTGFSRLKWLSLIVNARDGSEPTFGWPTAINFRELRSLLLVTGIHCCGLTPADKAEENPGLKVVARQL
jgi:hypothetical protein